MDLALDNPPPGQYPHRFTQDDRFQYRVRVQPVAGHLEFLIKAVDTRLPAMAAEREWMGNPKRQYNPEQTEAERLDNQLRAAGRAQRRVRLLCMEAGVDRLFTFTVRACHHLDRDTFLKVWDRFRRIMERTFKNWRYVATLEHHKSGELHMHVGMKGFVHVNTLRPLWHHCLNQALGRDKSLVSGPDSPGNVNVPNSRTRHLKKGVKASIAISTYIGKYIGKETVGEFNRRRYFHSKNVVVQPCQARWLESEDFGEALLEVCRLYNLTSHFVEFRLFSGCAFLRVDVNDLPDPPF